MIENPTYVHEKNGYLYGLQIIFYSHTSFKDYIFQTLALVFENLRAFEKKRNSIF